MLSLCLHSSFGTHVHYIQLIGSSYHTVLTAIWEISSKFPIFINLTYALPGKQNNSKV